MLIYKGVILPLLLYGAPVWIESMGYQNPSKAFHTMSSEALCILAGSSPITIKTVQAVKLYGIKKGKVTKNKQSTEK
jgi:hypothetical protein